MKIIVLNGSPKGELSVTMQFVAYLAKTFPQHEFKILHVAQKIKYLEKNQDAFNKIMEEIQSSDAVLWGFPLYVLLVHAHYKRFIELIFERNQSHVFAGKFTAALSTSIHFYDHTAHNYIHTICDDLNMKFFGSYSPDMNDLFIPEEQKRWLQFAELFFHTIENNLSLQRQYPPLTVRDFSYTPMQPVKQYATNGKKILLLHDENDPNSNLFKMVNQVKQTFLDKITVVNIRDLDIKASCLGCLECGGNNRCFYTGKDEYISFYQSQVMQADIIFYAGKIVDRFFSSRWKMFFDRIFFNTHTPVLIGKQIGIITSGPFSQIPNMMEIFQGFFQFQGANIAGVVSDEYGDSKELNQTINQFVFRTLAYSNQNYVSPQNFLGVGGAKIFRDDMYGRLRTVFAADHRAYKRLKIYKTFPQRDFKNQLLNTFIAPLVNLPPIRKKFDKMIKTQMVQPYKKLVKNYQPISE